MAEQIRIMIAEDHPIVRQGLEVLLAAQSDMELVGQATNGDEATEMALDTQPDLMCNFSGDH